MWQIMDGVSLLKQWLVMAVPLTVFALFWVLPKRFHL